MKFTLNWLKEYLDTDASLDEIATTLTNIGLEVEEIEDPSAKYAPFKSAYVVSAEQHPDADRLRVCKVDTGKEVIQVVCGAPNARTGMKGIFAPAGSYVPGTDLLLKKGKIRGQESNGMLVSEREMGISDEHDGIIELPKDTEIGIPFAKLYNMNDVMIEIGLTPNRADCAGIYGIARDLAAAGIGKLKTIEVPEIKGSYDSPVNVHFDFSEETKDACPHFTGRFIKGVKNGPSPTWLQQKLKSIGLRPISILVDITNLMTIGYNRPLHVFDADRLKGNITVRLSKEGEKFDALNDKSYTLKDNMTAITDENGLLGLGGIVGGTSTGVELDTVNLFVEAAYFDPIRTARTGRDLQVSSDARYRFERGIDPDFTKSGLDIAVQLILDLCGGEPSNLVETGTPPKVSKDIEYDPKHVEKLVGIDVPSSNQISILEKLGCEVKKSGEKLTITTPSWRGDMFYSECVVEEVIRIHGLEHVEALSVKGLNPTTMSTEPRARTLTRQARTALLSQGFDECVTWSFMPKDIAEIFGANDNMTPQLTLTNPISSDLDQMRPSILANLIMAGRDNGNKGFENAFLFEIGPVFRSSMADGEDTVCTLIRTGKKNDKHWSDPKADEGVDLYQIKSDVQAILSACGAPETLQVTRDAPDYYHPGRSASLRLGKNVLATFGELHPLASETLDIDVPVVGAEIYLENIPAPRKKDGATKPLLKISQFQPVKRDFAFILDENVEAENIIRSVKSSDKQLISNVNIFDVYQGKGVENGKKSLALSVTFQPTERTLTDSEIEGLSQKIINTIQQKTGGVLRG